MNSLKIIVYHDGKDYQTLAVKRENTNDWAETVDRLVGGVNWFESFAGMTHEEAIQDAIANGFVYRSKEEMDAIKAKHRK